MQTARNRKSQNHKRVFIQLTNGNYSDSDKVSTIYHDELLTMLNLECSRILYRWCYSSR